METLKLQNQCTLVLPAKPTPKKKKKKKKKKDKLQATCIGQTQGLYKIYCLLNVRVEVVAKALKFHSFEIF